MMRHPTALVASAVAVASLGLAACSSSSSSPSAAASSPASASAASTSSAGSSPAASGPASGTPFNVLAIVASSGPLATVTAAEVAGMQAGVAYVNAHGGVSGHQVVLTVKNDNNDPTTAATLLQSALSGGSKPDAVYAGTTSTETYAMEPILTQNKILSVQTATSDQTMNPSTFPYAFSLASSSADFASELATAIKAQYPKVKNIGIIIGNDVTGSSNLHNEQIALQKAGYTTTVEQYDPTNTINMTPQLQALQAKKPDLLVAGGFGEVAGYILKGRTQIGWNIPTVGDASFSSNSLPALASNTALTGVSILSQKNEIYAPLSQHNAAFQTLYKAAKPSGGIPFLLYEYGWDSILVDTAAAVQAKSFDGPALAQALESLTDSNDPNFLLGPYKYSPSVHTAIPNLGAALLASPYSKDGQPLPFGQTG
jgi:branched-chain amino acid transport system substrate-binding protein